jgi:hypothetical protein
MHEGDDSHGNCRRDFRYPLPGISSRLTKNQFRKLPSVVRPAPKFRIFLCEHCELESIPQTCRPSLSAWAQPGPNACMKLPVSDGIAFGAMPPTEFNRQATGGSRR